MFKRKFPDKYSDMELFLEKLPYELFTLEKINIKKYPKVRDMNDIPVLANAIESKADLLITGDKDFDEIKTNRLIIMKPGEYFYEYMRTWWKDKGIWEPGWCRGTATGKSGYVQNADCEEWEKCNGGL